MGRYYQNEKEIESVVQGFESCTTGPDDFKHHQHLTVAVWYLRNSTPEQAFPRMCSGLLRFLDHHAVGRSTYNEALTKSWINLIHSTLEQMDANLPLLEVTNSVLARLADKRVVFDYDKELDSKVSK